MIDTVNSRLHKEAVVILVLVTEIISAVIALGLVITMIVRLMQYINAQRHQKPFEVGRLWHRTLAFILLGAVVLHGCTAMIYASGTNFLTYVFGWVALGLLVLSALCMAPFIRQRLIHPQRWHNGFFISAVVLIIAHFIANRL